MHPGDGGVRRVAIGTGSTIKIEALREALDDTLGAGCYEVLAVVDAESGVRPQPVGLEETELGARNRAAAARARYPDAEFAVGIENGMWPMAEPTGGCRDEDAACIVVLVSGAQEEVRWSDALPIPTQRPFPMGRNGEWSALKDPHAVLTNGTRPRKQFLKDALIQLFRTM
jgi:non-canonical (house-cleaning) NTP pyrophosphatase